MKYKELTIEEARLTCKRHSKKCEKCPLRRERIETDEKGNKRIMQLFCWFIIYNLANEEEKEMLIDEEIKHADEYMQFKAKYL